MGADGVDAPPVHDDDPIRILHGGDALGNDDLRGFRNVGMQALTDQRIRFCVHGAGGVVQNEDLGMLEQGPGNAQPLLLPAGHIGAALFDVGIVALRESPDEVVRLGQLTDLHQLFVGGARIAPPEVFLDGAGKEHIFLQHHGHRIPQGLQIIRPDVLTAYGYGPHGGVV